MPDRNRVLAARTVAAMKQYPGWENLPPDAEKTWSRYIRRAPVVLSHRLTSQVNLTELLAAKLDWIEFLIHNSILRKVYGVYSGQETTRIAGNLNRQLILTQIGSPELPAALGRMYEQVQIINQIRYKPEDERIGNTGTERFVLETLGLTGLALAAYDRRILTIEELLKTQPWLILSV